MSPEHTPAVTRALAWRAAGGAARRLRFVSFAVPLSYGLLAAIFTGAFVTERGLVGETIWVELSAARPGWEGFLYPYDPSRRLLSVPFHLAYLISDRSYLPLHVINGVFLWLTGLLTCLIVRMLVPGHAFLAFCAGAIALTHGADRTIGMVALVQVRQSVVATLVAVLCLVVGWKQQRQRWLVPAGAAQATALWTYEPALPVLATALVLLVHRPVQWRRVGPWAIGWLAVPFLYVATLFERYVVSGESSYQASRVVSRSLVETLGLALALPVDGILFPQWPVGWWTTVADGCQDLVASRLWIPVAIGAATFCVTAALARLPGRKHDASTTLSWLGTAAVMLLAAYAPYLFVGNVVAPNLPPGYWRVHYYAAPVIGFVLATLAAFVGSRGGLRGKAVALIFSALVVATGLSCGLLAQMQEERRWNEYRRVLLGILDAAPRVKDDTFVALLGMPATRTTSLCLATPPADPFFDTMWFNSALQLLYPGTRVAGSYWREDGSTSGAVRYAFTDEGVVLERTEVTVEGERFRYDQVLAFEFDPNAGVRLLTTLPTGLVPGSLNGVYTPSTRVVPGSSASEAVERFSQRPAFSR